jgi:hypothetical protein
MNIIIACEYSGLIREAFNAKGHNAWSVDLLPSEQPGKHIQGNILHHIYYGYWDMLIGNPPCTFTAYSGNSSWDEPGRFEKRIDALLFFGKLWNCPIEKICLENPRGCVSPTVAKYTQEIQPYYFGDDNMKTTWLWLKGLPKLIHNKQNTLFESGSHTTKPEPIYIDTESGKKRYFTEAIGGITDGGHKRSRTFSGIAKAMADQWG